MLFARSLIFNLGLWLSVLVYAPLVLLTAPLPRDTRYRIISQWARFALWWLAVTCGLRYVVEGHPPEEPGVLVANHQSAWETLALQVILPAQSWVLKRELLWLPLFGWALALTWPIAIDRGRGRHALEAVLTRGAVRLAAGRWVVIFPEGTRSPAGHVGRFGLGAARLALASGVAITPLAHDAGHYWPRRGFLKRPGVIRVVIGAPIAPVGSAEELTAKARGWIASHLKPARDQ